MARRQLIKSAAGLNAHIGDTQRAWASHTCSRGCAGSEADHERLKLAAKEAIEMKTNPGSRG